MIIVVIHIYRKDLKVEKNLKLVLIINGLAVTMRAVYNFTYLALGDKNEEESDELEFGLWCLQSKSAGLMSLAFLIVIAKLFSIIIAFSRRKLVKSLELIKRSNQIIFYLSLAILTLIVINDTIMIALYLAESGNSSF